MPAITAENAHIWQDIANKLGATRPSVGKHITVDHGKHRGRTGTVERHMPSHFKDPYRYADEAQAHMIDMAGRYGFVVLVRPDDDSKEFWVNAEYAVVDQPVVIDHDLMRADDDGMALRT